MLRILSNLLLPLLVAITGSAFAIEAIPQETGWSGYLRIGAGVLQAETNMVSGIDKYSIEVGDARIDSLDDGPDSRSEPVPQLNLNLKYTFSTQTQAFIGSNLEDIVQLDMITVFGVRQQFSDRSILELSAVSSPPYGIETWEDPYVVGEDRKKTDRSNFGFRLEYDKILGTGFGVQYTQRETEIDDERSGTTQLGLSSEQAALLNREGDTTSLLLNYTFRPVNRSLYSVRVGVSDDDRDGDAMSGDSNRVQLTHVYLGDRYITAVNVSLFSKEYDARNPVFDKTRDDDGFGLAFFVFDKGLFDSKDWWGQASVVYVEQDSNIDFYDQSSTALILGAQRNF